MTVVDWGIIVVIVISMLMSMRHGFVREAISLGTWVAAIVIARLFAENFSVLLEAQIDTPSLRLGASYIILFVGTLIVGGMVNYLVGEFVEMTGLTGTDRFLGMLFGLARGAIVVLLIVAGLHYLAPVKDDDWYAQSKLIPPIVGVVEQVAPIVWERGVEMFQDSTAIPETVSETAEGL